MNNVTKFITWPMSLLTHLLLVISGRARVKTNIANIIDRAICLSCSIEGKKLIEDFCYQCYYHHKD